MARMLLSGCAGTYSVPLFTSTFPSLTPFAYAASNHKHVVLKTGTPDTLEGELEVLKLLRTIESNHFGTLLVRQMLDEFKVDSRVYFNVSYTRPSPTPSRQSERCFLTTHYSPAS